MYLPLLPGQVAKIPCSTSNPTSLNGDKVAPNTNPLPVTSRTSAYIHTKSSLHPSFLFLEQDPDYLQRLSSAPLRTTLVTYRPSHNYHVLAR